MRKTPARKVDVLARTRGGLKAAVAKVVKTFDVTTGQIAESLDDFRYGGGQGGAAGKIPLDAHFDSSAAIDGSAILWVVFISDPPGGHAGESISVCDVFGAQVL